MRAVYLFRWAEVGNSRPLSTSMHTVTGCCTSYSMFSGMLGSCALPYQNGTLEHMNLWDKVVEWASERHGYVTTRDARSLGVAPVELRKMAARGRLEHVARGAYRVSVLPRGANDDLAAAVAWALGRGVISHESALILHGLSDVNPSRVHLTVPPDNYPRGRGGELYRLHRRLLREAEVTEVDALPVTVVARTIRDCASAGTDPYQLRRAIDTAEAEGALRRGVADQLRTELVGRVEDGKPG